MSSYWPHIDYTKMRLNKRVDGGRIERCPACGKKGRMKERTHDGGVTLHWYADHTADDWGWAIAVTRSCHGPIVNGERIVKDET